MSMRQLRCADLNPGDLMLKMQDGTNLGRIISLGQRAAGQMNSFLVHAGIMFDRNYIIEGERDGVIGGDLRMRDLPFGYLVYRPVPDPLAKGAADCAKMIFDIHQQQGTVGYNFAGLPSSVSPGGRPMTAAGMEELLDGILHGRGHRFYCSQFVTYVYQFVAEQNNIGAARVFNVSDSRVSPSTLGSLLRNNPWFKEAGYMLPRER
jgi:hypothetical protein